MEKTEREEEAEAYKIVLKNCYFYHNSEPLPEKPWCLNTPNLASQLIQDLLEESKYDHKSFAKKCAKTLVDLKNMQLQEKIKLASLMRESLDIANEMKNISNMLASATSVRIKVQKTQSTRGPIIVHANVNNNLERLEEGDIYTFAVDYLGFIELKFILDDEDSNYPEIGECKIFFQQIIEEINYLKAMEKPELESTVCKKGKDYEIIIQLRLKLSKENRLEILRSKYNLIEPIMKNKSDTWTTFLAFQNNLSIKFNESSGEFESLISELKTRNTCCVT
ncbi:hypothetical protein SteCoe_38870 [Stentor coeruleus]|uniref:Uncharacterized protein n=1 Tax=Stentor coeruleus TaxID=5963 RepID=A0A1R2AL85_9CILI|nr:hypothetical protein SteCoe_38870 [Stentor coeruleus]